MKIKLGVSSELEHFRAVTYASKEPETLDWLEQNLTDHDVLFDVGANIGLYSLYAAKINSHCKIYAFEPESQNYARLCQNIVLNGVANILPCNFALSDRQTFGLFYVRDMQPGSALHSFGQLSQFRPPSERAILTQGALSATLDSLVGSASVPQPTLLKIDVDGIEERILDGAHTVLKSVQLRSILLEENASEDSAGGGIRNHLSGFGYTLLKKSAWVSEIGGMKSQNHIYQRS